MSLFNTPSSSGQSNNTTSTAPATGGLFGSTTPASGGLFGGAQAKTGTSAFSFPSTTSGGTSAATPSATAGTTSLFGASTAKPGEQKSLFPAPSGGTLGSSTPTSTAGTGAPASIFGATSQAPATTSLFGNKPAAASTTTGTSLFGNTSSTPNTTAASTTPATTTTTSASSIFGQDKTAASSKPGGLFGGGSSSAAPGSAGLFGGANANPASAAQATPAKPALFQNSTTPAGAPPSDASKPSGGLSLFNNNKPATQSSSSMFSAVQQGEKKDGQISNLLGTQASSPAKPTTTLTAATTSGAPSMFSSGSLFGAKPADASAAGAKPTSTGAADKAASTPSLFAQSAQPKPTDSAAAAKPSLFGNPAASSATSGSASSLFSTPAATPNTTTAAPATTATQASSLFGTANKPAASTTTTAESSKSQASSLFSGLSKPAAGTATPDAAKPASLFGTTPSSTAPSTNTPALGGATGASSAPSTTAATTSASAPAAGSLFGGSKAATSAESTAAKPAAPQTTGAGASTSGPTSSMARLKNKTMDEIMSRWATDLSKYQKEFKEQASQVAAWDRLLVENGEKIQKLYLNTFEAEKASREVERHLVTVESQQEELESWLDKYEVEVDALFSKQVAPGEALTGPDQERERTYKLAEKITERLDEMGRDLTKMIKEINEISGTVSKSSKPDDPLSQIVRVLNGHLTQLQWIDTNAAALQAKIAAAQKASSQIGNNHGGLEQDNVDSFYRSYMGRR